MKKKSNIIAFAGRKRSGKGMLSNGLKEYHSKSVIVTIADNLKYLCCDLLNVSYDELNKMKDDGTTFEKNVDKRWVNIIHKATKIENETIISEIGEHIFTSVREMLQVIGTDLIRKYVPNWHVDKTVERIESFGEDTLVIVDDLRFPNEKEAIEKLGGDVYFVIRPNCWEVSNHPSETALSYKDFNPNHVIINDLTEEQMITYFNAWYFNNEYLNDKEYPILLSSNPWYMENVMDTDTDEINFDQSRKFIINKVLSQNVGRILFKTKGIITFKAENDVVSELFRRIILNNNNSNSTEVQSYAIYNPLTNEILKGYMKTVSR